MVLQFRVHTYWIDGRTMVTLPLELTGRVSEMGNCFTCMEAIQIPSPLPIGYKIITASGHCASTVAQDKALSIMVSEPHQSPTIP